jgi:hypothetical protein
VIAASHGHLLGMEGVQRVVDRDGARVALIITAGSKA